MSRDRFSRREAAARFAAFLTASPILGAQAVPKLRGEPRGRIAPVDELVNTHEFEPMARRTLDRAAFESIAETAHAGFKRITFRPRMMVNTLALDLTTQLFGHSMFAPILVGPVAHQKQFHPGGEAVTATAAAAANALMVLSDRSDVPVESVVERAERGLWYQVYAADDAADDDRALERVKNAVRAGCAAVVVTVRDDESDWGILQRIRDAVSVPLVVKGVMEVRGAWAALANGANAIVVSDHGSGARDPIIALPKIADEVAGKVPVLVDGGFRRGGDVLKALALGASAVLVARPAMWGLAAYGAAGVQTALELIQTELARDMVMLGTANIAAIGREHVRVHGR